MQRRRGGASTALGPVARSEARPAVGIPAHSPRTSSGRAAGEARVGRGSTPHPACAIAPPGLQRILYTEEALMHIRNVAFARVAVAVFALLAPTAAAWAQAFPDRPITLIVPWPAGGSTDRHLRTLAEIAGRHLGQPIVVQNHPGAGGTLGPGNMAVTAKPDGYTIAQYPMGMLRLPHMQKTAWNPLTDFTFIIGVSGYTFGFTVLTDSPYKTFNEYIDAARAEPGKINYGSTGTGTSPHLLMEEIAINAKVTLNHIPFKGNADLVQALLGGHVMAQSDATGWDKYVDGGQMRLLVTFGENRTKRWPNVPTARSSAMAWCRARRTASSARRAWTRRW